MEITYAETIDKNIDNDIENARKYIVENASVSGIENLSIRCMKMTEWFGDTEENKQSIVGNTLK